MSVKETFTLSSLSLGSEDWDRSESDIKPLRGVAHDGSGRANVTPRNSVVFPRNGVEDTPRRALGQDRGECRGKRVGKDGRSLSELMRLHAEKGTDVSFSAEEASRVADVLKQWINSGTSPYESDDDFFSRSCAQDDSSLWPSKRSSRPPPIEPNGRPRGQSETLTLRLSPNPDFCASAGS